MCELCNDSRRDMRKWIGDVIADGKRIAIPIMTHPGIELIGRSVREAVTNGKIHYEAIAALDARYPSAATTVIMDLTVEAEAFGATVSFPENEIPTVTGHLLSDFGDVEKLVVPDLTAGRIPQYLLANRLAAMNVKDKPVFGGAIGPYSLAGRLYDISEFMMACYTEPETAELLLDKCTEFLVRYVVELKKQGIHGVVIAEPAAGLMSNDGCSEFSSRYVKRIVDAVQDDSFMVVLHNCGNTGHCTAAMVETGAAAYHFGNKIDMTAAVSGCPPQALVMGNLDPVSVFRAGTPESVREATLTLLEQMTQFPNFVLSSGCDVPPETPHANVEAFYEALQEFNALRN